MGRPEGVADVGVRQGGQLVGEAGIVPLLAWIEPQVLQHRHRSGPGRQDGLANLRTDDLVELANLLPQGLTERRRHRIQPELVDDLALRPAEVRAGHQRRPPFQQLPDGGNGGPDAQVVSDRSALQGHVQIAANQDGRAREVGEVFQGPQPARAHRPSEPGRHHVHQVHQPV